MSERDLDLIITLLKTVIFEAIDIGDPALDQVVADLNRVINDLNKLKTSKAVTHEN